MQTDIEPTDAARQWAYHSAMSSAGEDLAGFEPDVVVLFYPDHFIGFHLDLMPSFCVGLAASSATEFGIETTPLDVPADTGLDLVRHLHSRDFDVAFSHKMVVDHGGSLPLLRLTGSMARHPVLPVLINCVGDPRPSFRRVREFGAEVGRFFAGSGRRVAFVGSGGLSHDAPVGRFAKADPTRFLRENARSPEQQKAYEEHGVRNARAMMTGDTTASQQPSESWDMWFLERLLTFDQENLDAMTDDGIETDAGGGTHEVRTWVAATAAAREVADLEMNVSFYGVIPEWITGMGVMVGHGR
jgi:2,3-dihydroxyphenylpropionate 1,2-dioxygenase